MQNLVKHLRYFLWGEKGGGRGVEYLTALYSCLFEKSSSLDVMRFCIRFYKFVESLYYRFTVSLLCITNLDSEDLNILQRKQGKI